MTPVPTIAYFITDHGFGHASRAAAVMSAIERRTRKVRFEIFTTSPRWIYADSLAGHFGYHEVSTDVGVVQRSPLKEDLETTVQALKQWLPFDDRRLDHLADRLQRLGCHLVVCDVSALGIATARRAGVPSVLIENFTWDFIYGAYARQWPALGAVTEYLAGQYGHADFRLQTEPLCRRIQGTVCLPPIARVPRTERIEIRNQLNIPSDAKMVLVSMGGIPDRFEFLDRLPAGIGAYIVIPGSAQSTVSHPRVIHLPARSRFYHPDLVAAADLLVGKAGYSTIAEAYHAGVPFAYIARPQSPESPALEKFITDHLVCRSIGARDYAEGRWIDMLPELLRLEKSRPDRENGADEAARWIETRWSAH